MSKGWIIVLFAVSGLLACKTTNSIQQKAPFSKAETIINKAIEAHGGAAYLKGTYTFDFRKKNYSFSNTPTTFQYTRQDTKEGTIIKDMLTPTNFQRRVDNQLSTLSVEDNTKYSNSLNSVIYFALLPYKLNDPAVVKNYKGLTTIKGVSYHTLEISFKQEGGGTDFEDVFYYWIHQNDYTVDYLAYEFHVDKGGVRFRQAINSRTINGIRFQDYINFKAAKNTPLEQLPVLFEKEKLRKLSVIELENISVRSH